MCVCYLFPWWKWTWLERMLVSSIKQNKKQSEREKETKREREKSELFFLIRSIFRIFRYYISISFSILHARGRQHTINIAMRCNKQANFIWLNRFCSTIFSLSRNEKKNYCVIAMSCFFLFFNIIKVFFSIVVTIFKRKDVYIYKEYLVISNQLFFSSLNSYIFQTFISFK